MPELPEVQTLVDELKSFKGKTLQSIEVLKISILKGDTHFLERFEERKIKRVHRRCKYIVFDMDENLAILVHLGMTGKLLEEFSEKDEKHHHLSFHFTSNEKLHYVDPRRFGYVKLIQNLTQFLDSKGLEPLSSDFNSDFLIQKLEQKKTKIKSFLLDQKALCGIGNIYADESLFLARIHPLRTCASLNKNEVSLLCDAIKAVLRSAIENMGTTLSDYRRTKNLAGENQHYLKVYGQESKPCQNCSTKIEKVILAGRGTHFCPNCQRF